MELLTAIATATVFAVFGFPFRYYQCWFSFSPLATAVGTVLYLAVAGGGGGLVGWYVANLSHAQPTPSPPLNGVLYGIGGALALRADFRAQPKSAVSTSDQFKDARSALTTIINWTAEQLNDSTYRKAETWLFSLPDDQLAEEAWRIQAHIAGARMVNDKTKKQLLEQLVPAMEKLTKPAERSAGRAHLINFCASYYRNEHLPRTPRITPTNNRVRTLTP